jgi:putative oxygen-independent coproporphyrinogen III oxidase
MPIPLSLYIHIPWCLKKCPYCDFYSIQVHQDNFYEDQYIKALVQDFETDLHNVEQRTLTSIFIGGGTPSLLSPQSVEYLLNEIHKRISFQKDIEISLEANPGTVEQQRFVDFRIAGINRLSLGIQSFQDDKLKKLGRIHQANEAKQSIEIAKSVGFDRFNLDLMYGLPTQCLKDALYDLKTALSFNPPHLSWYQLTLEQNTPFGRHPPQTPSENELWAIQTKGQTLLHKAGYQHYEISTHSKPGYQCLHNMNYWQFGDYLGIGAGAHGKFTTNNGQKIIRYYKTTNIKNYISNHSRLNEMKTIPARNLPIEFMINALRLIEGVPALLFRERTGLNIKSISSALQQARERNLLDKNKKFIKTTALGQRFLNDCLEIFIAP